MYESHVTVDSISREDFLEVCRANKYKPVIIDYDTGSGVSQMMTAKFHKTKVMEKALEEMHEISSRFASIVRLKLEKIIGRNTAMPDSHLYMEYHSKYNVGYDKFHTFWQTVMESGLHMSQNSVKDPNFYFVTARTKEKHIEITKKLKDFLLIGTISECVVYDTNPSLDSNWECIECPIKKWI